MPVNKMLSGGDKIEIGSVDRIDFSTGTVYNANGIFKDTQCISKPFKVVDKINGHVEHDGVNPVPIEYLPQYLKYVLGTNITDEDLKMLGIVNRTSFDTQSHRISIAIDYLLRSRMAQK